MNLPEDTQPRLLQTTAVRLALRYALIYGLVLLTGLLALWWATGRHVTEEMEDSLEAEMQQLAALHSKGGIPALAQALKLQPENRQTVLVSPSNKKLGGTLVEWPEDGPDVDGEVRGQWVDDDAFPSTVDYEDDIYAAVIAVRFADGSRLLLADPIEESDGLEETTELLGIAAAALGAALVLGLIMSIFVSRQILRRLYAINETADEIMAGDLSRRIPVSNRNDEFDALASQLNAMLSRIQQLIKGIREVTDNIAHDLRSPLTRMRNNMEITLREKRDAAEYRNTLEHGIQEADSLIKTFNALLHIAQVEAGNHRSEWGPVRLDRLANDLIDLYEPLAEERQQVLEFHNGQPAEVHGSRDLLTSVLHNLLENAIKYSPEGGHIVLSIERSSKDIVVTVADNGPGIPETDQKRVLQRFVRLEDSRHTPGNGLGLSLVDAVARLHRAELTMTNTHPGLRISLRFPVRKRGSAEQAKD